MPKENYEQLYDIRSESPWKLKYRELINNKNFEKLQNSPQKGRIHLKSMNKIKIKNMNV